MMAQIAPTAREFLPLVGWLMVGLFLGVVYFRMVRRSADLLVSGSSLAMAITLVIARMAVLVAGLYLAATNGTLPLLVAAGGVMIGRRIVLNRGPSAA